MLYLNIFIRLELEQVLSATQDTLSFEDLLAWIDQLRGALEEEDDP